MLHRPCARQDIYARSFIRAHWDKHGGGSVLGQALAPCNANTPPHACQQTHFAACVVCIQEALHQPLLLKHNAQSSDATCRVAAQHHDVHAMRWCSRRVARNKVVRRMQGQPHQRRLQPARTRVIGRPRRRDRRVVLRGAVLWHILRACSAATMHITISLGTW